MFGSLFPDQYTSEYTSPIREKKKKKKSDIRNPDTVISHLPSPRLPVSPVALSPRLPVSPSLPSFASMLWPFSVLLCRSTPPVQSHQKNTKNNNNQVDKLLENIPKERTTFLFSATMTSKVQKLQRASLSDPERIEVQWISPLVFSASFVFFPFFCDGLGLVFVHGGCYPPFSAPPGHV